MRKFMFWIKLNAFIECFYCIFKFFLNCIDFSQTIISWNMIGVNLYAFLQPMNCFFLLSFLQGIDICKSKIRIGVILINLYTFFIVLCCLISISSLLGYKPQVIVRHLVRRTHLHAFFEQPNCLIILLLLLMGRTKSIVNSWIIFMSRLRNLIELFYLQVSSLFRNGKKVICIKALMIFGFGFSCPFLTLLFVILLYCFNKSKHSIALFEIRLQLSCLQIELFCFLIFPLIVENICQSNYDSIVIFIFAQAVTIPAFSFPIIFKLTKAKAQDVIRIRIIFMVLLAPTCYKSLTHSSSILNIPNSRNCIINTRNGFDNILAQLNSFLIFSIEVELVALRLPGNATELLHILIVLMYPSLMLL